MRLISSAELRARLGGISKTTLWRLAKTEPDFPRAVRVTPGKDGFSESEVIAFIESRKRKGGA
jgi:predicted DNA-binding transcriptional regulator AlpA